MANYPGTPSKYPGSPAKYPATLAAYPSFGLSPTQFTAAILAATTRTNIWLVHGDAGVNQVTTPGRVSSLTSQGGANDWTTLGATQEPTYTAADSTLNGKGTWSLDGTAKYMLNAFNPVAPATQPYYRLMVVQANAWLPSRVPTVLAASVNFGTITDSAIRQTAHSINGTSSPNLDFPSLQWLIVEEYFSGSTSDFVIVGPVDNIATGNFGNTNPATLAMGASNTGTLLSNSTYAFSAMWLGLPSAPERAALRALLLEYYSSEALLRTRKVCRYYPVGDSITLEVGVTNNDGWRKTLKDTFFTGLGYPAYSVGSTTAGTYGAEFTRHGGVSGETIAQCNTFLLDGATGQLRAGGPLVNSVQLLLLLIGTNDMPTYAAGTTAAAYRSLLDGIQAAVPSVRMAVSTITPQGDANNTNVIAFNAELPAVWDAFDAANPTRTLTRWDANTAIGGPTYVAGNFADVKHPNATGAALMGAAICTAISSIMNTLTTF